MDPMPNATESMPSSGHPMREVWWTPWALIREDAKACKRMHEGDSLPLRLASGHTFVCPTHPRYRKNLGLDGAMRGWAGKLHIPAHHEHAFRTNVNTDSGST